jgi:hypothetical protein
MQNNHIITIILSYLFYSSCLAYKLSVIECLDDWKIKDRITAMSFDTTSSNTGSKSGACTHIEAMIGRDLLHLACRHHMMEIVAARVLAVCGIPSTGPDILLFKRFQQYWKSIDQDRFEVIEGSIADREDILSFYNMHLAVKQPRDDYRELLEVSIIYLGGTPPRGIRFMQPGALHRARWMARIIYAIKLSLFKSQFIMTKQEQAGIKRYAAFCVNIYVRSWFEATDAAAAPANDLALLKRLALYEDKGIADAAVTAFSRHLWYLSEVLVSLSFFDEDTSLAVKRAMVKALDKEGSENPPKRISVNTSSSSFSGTTVANFVTKTSRRFFAILGLKTDFLMVDPSEWYGCTDYRVAADLVRAMRVVNDIAERGVALMQNFNTVLTKNEEQKQYLLQVVEQHQRTFLNEKKTTLAD